MRGGTLISENKGIMDTIGEWGPSALQETGGDFTKAAAGLALTGYGAPAAGF